MFPGTVHTPTVRSDVKQPIVQMRHTQTESQEKEEEAAAAEKDTGI